MKKEHFIYIGIGAVSLLILGSLYIKSKNKKAILPPNPIDNTDYTQANLIQNILHLEGLIGTNDEILTSLKIALSKMTNEELFDLQTYDENVLGGVKEENMNKDFVARILTIENKYHIFGY